MSATTLHSRILHVAAVGLVCWGLGASRVCELRCEKIANGPFDASQAAAGVASSAPAPSCHAQASAPSAPVHAPPASHQAHACGCTNGAIVQARAEQPPGGSPMILALAESEIWPGVRARTRHRASRRASALSIRVDRNPPLLI
ncbi:MAG: hypothetical protein OEM49_02710 [Myxococcales bacterium]|nr:hypothetical protein [Myxococcales bacterium]MDH5306894.1 hypothetical protein [Myxococcales bacterium]MDH5566579.1 hypothetical protein [Myxococcales bacterium]